MPKLLCAVSPKDIDQFIKIMGMEIWDLTERMLMDRKSIASSDRHYSFADKCGKIRELEKLDNSDTKHIKKVQKTFTVYKVLADHAKQKCFRLIGGLFCLLLLV